MYIDYEYYKSLGGVLSEDAYNRYVRQALAYLEHLTFGRINQKQSEPITGKIKDASCALVDIFYTEEQEPGAIVSQSKGTWHESYAAPEQTTGQKKLSIAYLYLANTGLLYRG